jgi:methylenetetrahydrofolate dehydrogenase (NAD+)
MLPILSTNLNKFRYSIRFIEPQSLSSSITPSITAVIPVIEDDAPLGTVKSILPCTPLAIVKCLEHVGVYNKILMYGDRAYGRTVTVINRSVVFNVFT